MILFNIVMVMEDSTYLWKRQVYTTSLRLRLRSSQILIVSEFIILHKCFAIFFYCSRIQKKGPGAPRICLCDALSREFLNTFYDLHFQERFIYIMR